MKSLNNVKLVSGAEIQADGSTTPTGRIRFNSNLMPNTWEYSTDNGTSWRQFGDGLASIQGGLTGQVLTKNSSGDYDASWQTLQALPTGGNTGQALVKTSGTDFESNWATVTNTVNGDSGNVNIGFVSDLIIYVNNVIGDDTTAQVGNILKQYRTIGAAIIAAMGINYSTIEVADGTYTIGDFDTPGSDQLVGNTIGYGLMFPGARYNYYFHDNVIINYTGTYGVYISGIGTEGSIYGYPTINVSNSNLTAYVPDALSGSQGGYAINITTNSSIKEINIGSLYCQSHGIRLGDTGYNSGAIFRLNVKKYISSANGISLKCDRGTVSTINGVTTDSTILTSTTSESLHIDGVDYLEFNNIKIHSVGIYSDPMEVQPIGTVIKFRTDLLNSSPTVYSKNRIEFNNVKFVYYQDDVNYKLIDFIFVNNTSGITMNENMSFNNCYWLNRIQSDFSILGNSFYTDSNVSCILNNVLGNADIGGSGTVTNLKNGIGFIYNPNITLS